MSKADANHHRDDERAQAVDLLNASHVFPTAVMVKIINTEVESALNELPSFTILAAY